MTADRLSAVRHPGEVLVEVLGEHGVSAYRIAAIMGVPYERLYQIVVGRRRISPDTALRLERALGLSAEYWLRLQAAYDLGRAWALRGDEIARIERVPGRSVDDSVQGVAAAC